MEALVANRLLGGAAMQTRSQEAQAGESQWVLEELEVRRQTRRAQREEVVRAAVVPGSAPEHLSLVPIPLADLCGASTRREMLSTVVPAGAHVRRTVPVKAALVSVQKTRSNVVTAASTPHQIRQTVAVAERHAALKKSVQVASVFPLAASANKNAWARA